MAHLVGASEIAEMLGITRQRVHQLAGQPGFPEPVGVLGAGTRRTRIWQRADIEQWMRSSGWLRPHDD